jgi:hypothetical protein
MVLLVVLALSLLIWLQFRGREGARISYEFKLLPNDK